jgi:uncharacterized SAM-binding protein YcdF (DUF218 family)
MLLGPLERAYPVPSVNDIRQCDAYVILGGGANGNAPSIDGMGMPGGDTLYRIMAGYRLHTLSRKPVIISAGDFHGHGTEAQITKRFLINLGVREQDLIVESKSKDTRENALFTKGICERYGFRRILLITNAYHMRRSVMLFNKFVGPVTPYPTGFKVMGGAGDLFQYLPDAGNMANVSTALKEYLGILFYKLTL